MGRYHQFEEDIFLEIDILNKVFMEIWHFEYGFNGNFGIKGHNGDLAFRS